MLALIGSIGVFGVLTIIDILRDNIPITLEPDSIGLVNNNIYSEDYGEYAEVFEYPVYQLTFTGSSVLFNVTDDNNFIEYILSSPAFINEYDFGDLTIYMFLKNGTIYYLSKSIDIDKYVLYTSYVKIGTGDTYVPIAPCEYFELGTYSNHTSGDFHSMTTLSWDEIKAHYIAFYSDHITINNQSQITLEVESDTEYLISYYNLSIHIELID